MSSEMYSTNPSLIAAFAIGVPPWLGEFANVQFSPDFSIINLGWVGFGIGIFFVSLAISISWGVGYRGIVLQCPIITGIGSLAGLIGWNNAGNLPLIWANAILISVLIIVILYTLKTKSLK